MQFVIPPFAGKRSSDATRGAGRGAGKARAKPRERDAKSRTDMDFGSDTLSRDMACIFGRRVALERRAARRGQRPGGDRTPDC